MENDQEVIENNRKMQERRELYRWLGYDTEAERTLILEAAGVLDGRILELGTGKGYMSVALARRGFRFITIDISAGEQSFARLNLRYCGLENRVTFVLGSGDSLPFAARSLDRVISINTLHHLDNPGRVLDELERVAATGAVLVMSDFTDEGFELVERVHRMEGRHHPVEGICVRAAASRLNQAGFETVVSNSRYQETLVARRPD